MYIYICMYININIIYIYICVYIYIFIDLFKGLRLTAGRRPMKGRRKQVGARSVQLLYRVAKVWVLWLWLGVRREWCALRHQPCCKNHVFYHVFWYGSDQKSIKKRPFWSQVRAYVDPMLTMFVRDRGWKAFKMTFFRFFPLPGAQNHEKTNVF